MNELLCGKCFTVVSLRVPLQHGAVAHHVAFANFDVDVVSACLAGGDDLQQSQYLAFAANNAVLGFEPVAQGVGLMLRRECLQSSDVGRLAQLLQIKFC